jgi:eukaryotic-like serine/threonine-protein kinase
MTPQTFGKFQLLKKLATGGMAEVWLARHSGIEGFQRMLVLKRILPHLADDPEFVQMFLNEAKIAARFNHPNIAQIYDLGEANGTYYIAMEFVHGEDLGRVMRKAWNSGQWVAQPLAIRIVASACEGLFYAHSKTDDKGQPLKVVHRDISPQNILISFDGSVKLVDFGIAKAADAQSMTRSGAIKGKFAYMSPEQAGGRVVDQRSDLFSIGLVLYELLTGVRPLKRDTELATLQAALECKIEPPSKVADVPRELDSVVMGALARAADDRYRDARTFQMELEEFLVSQRWVATSVQVSELMSTLFHERLEEEARLGYPDPVSDESGSGTAPPPLPPPLPREGTSTQAVEMTWDAPPATGPVREPELRAPAPRRRAEVPASRRNSGETRGPDVPRSRSSSRVDLVASSAETQGSPRRLSSKQVPVVEGEPAPRRTRSRPSLPEVRRDDPDQELTQLPDDRSDAEVWPKRRTGQYSLGVAPRRTRSSSMPEAPLPPPRPYEVEDDHEDTSAGNRGGGRKVKWMVGAALVLATAGAGALFKEPVLKFLTSTANDGAEMILSVDSNIPVQIYVEHHPDEGRLDQVEFLGPSPLKKARGVHVRDTLVFENKTQGLHQREVISMGQPGEHRKLEKTFKTGTYRFRFAPRELKDLTILLNGQEVASYPGPAVTLVEGKHKLEVRGLQLSAPVPIEIEIKPEAATEGQVIDLGAHTF